MFIRIVSTPGQGMAGAHLAGPCRTHNKDSKFAHVGRDLVSFIKGKTARWHHDNDNNITIY